MIYKFEWIKSLASVLLLLTSVIPAGGAGRSDKIAERFINDFSNKIIAVIRDKDQPIAERKDWIRAILLNHTDSKRITIFMLGRYTRKIKPNELKQYIDLIEEYTMRIFVNRMLFSKNAHTANIKVISSTKKGSKGKEVIVLTTLSAQGLKQPIQIRWWLVRNKQGVFKIFNLGVEGFWLAQEQRSQFSSMIQRNRGDPKILLSYLRSKIKELEQNKNPGDLDSIRQR